MAKETHTYRENENPTTWQSTRTKRAFDEFEESVKRFRSVADSCYDSDEFVAENYHESGKIFHLTWTNFRLQNFISRDN